MGFVRMVHVLFVKQTFQVHFRLIKNHKYRVVVHVPAMTFEDAILKEAWPLFIETMEKSYPTESVELAEWEIEQINILDPLP